MFCLQARKDPFQKLIKLPLHEIIIYTFGSVYQTEIL